MFVEIWSGLRGMLSDAEHWTLVILPDAAAASEAVADLVTETIHARPGAALSLPTGSTPLGLFDILAARVARHEVDFSDTHFFCLDEYIGVTAEDPNSLTRWLWHAFLSRIGAKPEHVHALPAIANDLPAAAAEFDRAVSACGGLDLAVLGLGPNGHIGYNEPGSTADSRTRVITLTPESRTQASAYWEGAVPIPHQAMTMGVGTLLEANKIALLVTGDAKADILRRTLDEPMSADVPASWLRIAGPKLMVIADVAAASELSTIRSR